MILYLIVSCLITIWVQYNVYYTILLIYYLLVIPMTILFQGYYTLNSISTNYTLVVYLVLKSPVWVIQQTSLVILLHVISNLLLPSYDKSFTIGSFDLFAHE